MFYTDTHAHVHMKPLSSTADEVIKRAAASGVGRMITIGTTVADSKDAVKMAGKYSNVYAAVGVHPHDAQEFDYKQLGVLEELAQNPKVLAIGEVGLDFYRDLSPRDRQKEVFSTMIDLASASNLPIIIHERDAAPDLTAVFDDMLGGADQRILFHCFSGAQHILDWAMDRKNTMFSFAGNVTYPKAMQLHEALAQIPLERLFIETDCPYLAPVPQRGKQNEPSYLPYTAEYVAKAKNISTDALAEQLEANFKNFFKVN